MENDMTLRKGITPMNGIELKARRAAAQRKRRATRPRVDYYPDAVALAVLKKLRVHRVGGDASSILNQIIAEWAQRRIPKTRSAKASGIM